MRVHLLSAVAWFMAAGLTACGGDSDPAGPGGPVGSGPYEATLESDELLSGGTGVLVSDGFAGLQLEPALDEEGLIIPDRWSNLHVTVGGGEVDARRLDARRVEFSVPTLTAGAYDVDVSTTLFQGSVSARVLGVIESRQILPCFIGPPTVAFVRVGDALFFDTDCTLESRRGVGVMWPAVPHRGFRWLPDGAVPEDASWAPVGPSSRPNHFVARRSGTADFWVWEAGPEPSPVEPLDCFGTANVSREFAAPVEVGDGICLLIAPQNFTVLRNGEHIADCSCIGEFVMSDDHWVTARRGAPLVVFNASGELVLSKEIGFIRDVRFAPDGGPLYAATTGHPSNRTGDRLRIIDRETGNLLHERTVTGAVRAIAVSTDRLWIARSTFRTGLETGEPVAEELFVELLDPETLEPIRSITVSPTLAVQHGSWPYHGETPLLLEDATGTRLTYTGNADHLGVWSHVIEVF